MNASVAKRLSILTLLWFVLSLKRVLKHVRATLHTLNYYRFFGYPEFLWKPENYTAKQEITKVDVKIYQEAS